MASSGLMIASRVVNIPKNRVRYEFIADLPERVVDQVTLADQEQITSIHCRTVRNLCTETADLRPQRRRSIRRQDHLLADTQSAARSAIMIEAALVLPPTSVGMIEASTTRSPSMPCTRNWLSTTACSSLPILQVPTG
ncbi:hypothetical protein D3C71_654210 [compost metagenome]